MVCAEKMRLITVYAITERFAIAVARFRLSTRGEFKKSFAATEAVGAECSEAGRWAERRSLLLQGYPHKVWSARKKCGSSLCTPPSPNDSRLRWLDSALQPEENSKSPSQLPRQYAPNTARRGAPFRSTGTSIAAKAFWVARAKAQDGFNCECAGRTKLVS
jgi:hypothetical protein